MLFLKLVCLIVISNFGYAIEQPQYQVSIWMKHPIGLENTIDTYLCKGTIIHESLILTTSDCLHYKVIGSNIVNTITSKMITIVAGSSKSLIYSNVTSIEVAKDFNSLTLENDLAILRLNESLPLDSRNDIKWIILDDHFDHKNNSCNVNFQNSIVPVQNTQQTHPVQILDNQNCTNTTNFKSPRRNDICSLYVLNSGSACNITENDIHSSSDRGTALICDSKLIGILSQIIPRDVNKTCSDTKSLNALYTRVATYLNWIYEKIAVASVIDMKKPNHTMSPPYVASAPAPTISQVPVEKNHPQDEMHSTTMKITTTHPALQPIEPSTTTTTPTTSTTKLTNIQSIPVVSTTECPHTEKNANNQTKTKSNARISSVQINVLLTCLVAVALTFFLVSL